ncbi:MAG TPA: hypothetical protein P5133_04335, partial [Spirochaetia bacterium]|nr:hypothetical protein [Spirochaetia bacterium]
DVSIRVRSGSAKLREGSQAIGAEMGELQRATLILREAAQGISASKVEIAEASQAVAELADRNRGSIDALEELLRGYVCS